MSKISFLSYLPKKLPVVMLGIILAFAVTATALAAFGPDRPTKVYNGPGTPGFDHVTFNSFTNVPKFGDERQFFNGQYADQAQTYYPTLKQLRRGDEITMHVYIHNGADSKLNASGKGIAKDVNVKVELPSGVAKGTRSGKATISASNAKPQSIYSTVDFAAENGGFYGLNYVEGSAKLVGNGVNKSISDNLVTSGVNIGDVKGCFEYAVAVTFKVKVEMPRYEVQKQVAVPGQPWGEVARQKVGDTTSWLISFENKGDNVLKNVNIVDTLPPFTKVVPGTIQVFDSNSPNGYTYPDTAIQANGKQINVGIGDYAPGAKGYIKFKTTIEDVKELECGTHRLQNVAYATPEGYGAVNDGANVIVESEKCENPEYTYDCESLVTIIDKKARSVKAELTAVKSGNVTVEGYSIDFGDGTVVNEQSATHTYAKKGNYTITGTITFSVNGETKSVDCVDTVSFDSTTTPEEPGDKGGQPTTLPNTGAGSMLAAIFGAGSVTAAARSYIESRRALKNLVG